MQHLHLGLLSKDQKLLFFSAAGKVTAGAHVSLASIEFVQTPRVCAGFGGGN